MELFQNKIFSAGFFLTAVVFFLLNQIEFDAPSWFGALIKSSSWGFPFPYRREYLNAHIEPEVIVEGLFGDVLIGVVACFVGGFLCQTIAENFARHREIKKFEQEAKTLK